MTTHRRPGYFIPMPKVRVPRLYHPIFVLLWGMTVGLALAMWCMFVATWNMLVAMVLMFVFMARASVQIVRFSAKAIVAVGAACAALAALVGRSGRRQKDGAPISTE